MYPMLNTSLGPKSLGHLWILPDGIGERVFQIIFGPPLGIIYLLGSAHTSYMQLFLENNKRVITWADIHWINSIDSFLKQKCLNFY